MIREVDVIFRETLIRSQQLLTGKIAMATAVFVSVWRGCCGPPHTDDLGLASQTACFFRGTPSKGLPCCWADYHKKSTQMALNDITKIFI